MTIIHIFNTNSCYDIFNLEKTNKKVGEKVKRRIMTAGMLAMMLAMGMTGCGKSDTKIDEATKQSRLQKLTAMEKKSSQIMKQT